MLSWKNRFKIWLFNFYPPYFGARIKITKIARDLTFFRTEMNLSVFNRNYVGVHFGGSLYSMCDPFFMLILLENLGKDYIVWDKSANIEFIKPGVGKVSAEFFIPLEVIESIKKEIEVKRKGTYRFPAEVKDFHGDVVAKVSKEIYIRKRGKLPIQNS